MTSPIPHVGVFVYYFLTAVFPSHCWLRLREVVCISACAFTSSQPAHKAGLLTRRPPYDQSRKLRRGAGAAVLSSMQVWATCSRSSPVPAAVFATFHQCTCHGPCLVLHLGGSDRTQFTMAVSSAWSLGVPRTGLLSLPGPGENCGSCFRKGTYPSAVHGMVLVQNLGPALLFTLASSTSCTRRLVPTPHPPRLAVAIPTLWLQLSVTLPFFMLLVILVARSYHLLGRLLGW